MRKDIKQLITLDHLAIAREIEVRNILARETKYHGDATKLLEEINIGEDL